MDRVELPSATNHLFNLGTGLSRPQVFECSDDIDRVVKLRGLCDDSSLASDWMGALLAVDLNILTPSPSLVQVGDDAIRTMPAELAETAKPGLAYGNSYILQASNVLGMEGLLACANAGELLGRLVALDTWIETEDRMTPEFGRNLLIDRDGPDPLLLAIDFGMCFSRALRVILGGADRGLRLVMHPSLLTLIDEAALNAAVSRIEEMSDAEIITVVNSTPDEWLSDSTKGRVAAALMKARHEVRPAVYLGLEAMRL